LIKKHSFHATTLIPCLSSLSALESHIQTLLDAAATTTEAVNAIGETIAAWLQHIPNHVQQVTSHGIHHGAAIALAVVETQFENDLHTLHHVFPEGEAREDFEELINDLGMVATIIGEEVNVDTIISNIFIEE